MTLVAPATGTSAYVGHDVTFTAKVTAADGSTPKGVVRWDDAGACMSYVAEGAVGADGTATMTYAHDRAYDSYSLNACFYPDDDDEYTTSEDFNCCLDVRTIPTTTVQVSPAPPAEARTGQPVTFTAKVTAADGSTPKGVVRWDDAGACMSYVAEGAVGADGTATMTYTHTTPYDSYSLNACFYPDDDAVYQTSEDFSCCLDVGPVTTRTTIGSVTPSGGARTGQAVTMRVALTAGDGSFPAGTVTWQATGACGSGSPVASSSVGTDGRAALTHTFAATGTYRLKACFVATDAGQYQNSTDDNGTYAITKPPPNQAPTVTKQPTSVVTVSGRTATYSADATGSPTPSVQWQVSRDRGRTWSTISGATGRTLSFTAVAGDSANLYRASFTNVVGKVSTRVVQLLVTHAFRGYTSPAAKASYRAGSSMPVAFTLGGPTGAALSDTTARAVTLSLQLRSPKDALTTHLSCPYDVARHQYRCALRIPAGSAPGTYQLLTITRLGTGPWVPAIPTGTAVNPQAVAVAR